MTEIGERTVIFSKVKTISVKRRLKPRDIYNEKRE